MITFFEGPIAVEDDDFELFAERFIPRIEKKKSEIAFSFTGTDYRAEGVAVYDEDKGFFMAPRIKLKFNNFAITETVNVASVRIDYVEVNPEKGKAYFQGLWIENGNDWRIEGKLKNNVKKKTIKTRNTKAKIS